MTALTLNSLYLSPQRVWEIVKRIQALEEGGGGGGSDVTKESLGLGRVDNTSDQEKPPSQPTQLLLQAVSNDLNDAIELRPLATVVTANLKAHTDLKNNPHTVTKAQVGLGNVDNTSDNDKPVSSLTRAFVMGSFNDLLEEVQLKADSEVTYTKTEVDANLKVHTDLKNNPHAVTKAQVGLGSVDNTADLNKPISTATTTALAGKADKSDTYTKAEVDALIEALKTSTG